eukprot:TRINITY_DN7428_c0_g1_i1.p1 TRINITY_DN7428_c0_g1~~TRINITY_DN7428_c0_g1_i1.p1  ORF type:complete len:269 (-),score=40.14 TRINITY_DN7428_c0_g1_i1:131-937(-)
MCIRDSANSQPARLTRRTGLVKFQTPIQILQLACKDDMMDRRNLMITAELNDKLKRDLLILPATVRFGTIKSGCSYETSIFVKNEDIMEQRINLRNPRSSFIISRQKKLGPIALGLNREIVVRIEANDQIMGKIEDEFEIISKHSVYKIPIYANVVTPQNFDKMDKESRQISNKPVLRENVKEIKGEGDNAGHGETDNFMDSYGSEHIIPKATTFEKNAKLSLHPKNKKELLDSGDNSISFNKSRQLLTLLHLLGSCQNDYESSSFPT